MATPPASPDEEYLAERRRVTNVLWPGVVGIEVDPPDWTLTTDPHVVWDYDDFLCVIPPAELETSP